MVGLAPLVVALTDLTVVVRADPLTVVARADPCWLIISARVVTMPVIAASRITESRAGRWAGRKFTGASFESGGPLRAPSGDSPVIPASH